MLNFDHVDSKDFLNSMTDKQRQQWSKAIVNRLMSAWQITEHKALAQILGIHSNTPSNWIQKKAVPWTVIYTCHKETGKSLDWLYNGQQAAIEITPTIAKQFDSAATILLSTCQKMGLINEAKKGGFESIITGMKGNFVEIIQQNSNN